MPYINSKEREKLDSSIKQLADKLIDVIHFGSTGDGLQAGRFNYVMTKLILEFFEGCKEKVDHYEVGYSDWNDIIGALECCKLELYRMQIAPYEDVKIKQNGPVLKKNK